MKAEKAPLQEQEICIGCGICCDGTLFAHASLGPGEKGSLPVLIERNVFTIDKKDFFRLPCLYFSGRCTIYDSRRAVVCGAFRCRLLIDMSDGKIPPGEAGEIVQRAKAMRSELIQEFRELTSSEGELYLTRILRELGKRSEPSSGIGSPDPEYELLQAKCNIFEALLIKHFRPADAFDKLVMK